MQYHWVVQIRQHILAICLLRTTALFTKDHSVFFFLESGLIKQQNETCGLIRTTNYRNLLMSFLKFVSRHEEASGGGASFVQQGGLIARQNLTNVSRTTCGAISTNLPLSGP